MEEEERRLKISKFVYFCILQFALLNSSRVRGIVCQTRRKRLQCKVQQKTQTRRKTNLNKGKESANELDPNYYSPHSLYVGFPLRLHPYELVAHQSKRGESTGLHHSPHLVHRRTSRHEVLVLDCEF